MTCLSFSTDHKLSDVENVLRLETCDCRHVSFATELPFPQVLPHHRVVSRSFLFSGIPEGVHFFTASTTTTKNMYQGLNKSQFLSTKFFREVGNAI